MVIGVLQIAVKALLPMTQSMNVTKLAKIIIKVKQATKQQHKMRYFRHDGQYFSM